MLGPAAARHLKVQPTLGRHASLVSRGMKRPIRTNAACREVFASTVEPERPGYGAGVRAILWPATRRSAPVDRPALCPPTTSSCHVAAMRG